MTDTIYRSEIRTFLMKRMSEPGIIRRMEGVIRFAARLDSAAGVVWTADYVGIEEL